jgi:hypothetical protein
MRFTTVPKSCALSTIRVGLPFLSSSCNCFKMSSNDLRRIRLGRKGPKTRMRYKPYKLFPSLCLLRTSAGAPFRYVVFQFDKPRNEILKLVFDILAFLGWMPQRYHETIRGSQGDSADAHLVVSDKRSDASQTRFERRASIGRLLRDV